MLYAHMKRLILFNGPDGEIGRHKGLKIPRLNGRAGSIPAPGTSHKKAIRK